ncbi:hypothetical protein NCS55_00987700 [Fusarium keratoplasticum]|nr:hypothetical protein NCS55_00987700 [Fusarium keratoplasticum]
MGMLLRLQDRHRLLRLALSVCCLLSFTGFLIQTLLSFPREWEVTRPENVPPPDALVKPNVTVSGLVFYGRKSRVESMRCYIERNLVDNGGWLDEVLWVVNTKNQDDLFYLDEIVASNPTRHKLLIPEGHLATYTYWKAWQHLERDKYYVKIDDDILWIEDGAIPKLVTHKIENPDTFVVSGNIINNPPLGFMHYRMGALHPYLPELEKPDHVTNVSDFWKPSKHPHWNGPNDTVWNPMRPPPGHENVRWLRVEDEKMMWQTPVHQLTYAVWGDSYKSWAIASQMHYSLFENIEKDTLDLYKFEKPWTMHGDRIRINFMCVYANDILDNDVGHWPGNRGDEDMIVLDLPNTLRRPVVILGTALASHFQYMDQSDLAKTDILSRYRSLAQDRACDRMTSKT